MNVPEHIAIIMDGNGRWAKKRFLPRTAGHIKGAEVFQQITRYCQKIGVKALTVYAFSTENWSRPPEEVEAIMNLLRKYLNDADLFKDENIRIRFIGDITALADDLQKEILHIEDYSRNNDGLLLNIAINYGGRQEIVFAARSLAKDVLEGKISPEDIDENMFNDRVFTNDCPPVDMILRPSGEERISNFLLWQCAYSEFVYMDVLWPDFTPADLDKAIEEYSNRQRRFGGI